MPVRPAHVQAPRAPSCPWPGPALLPALLKEARDELARRASLGGLFLNELNGQERREFKASYGPERTQGFVISYLRATGRIKERR